MSCGFGAQLSLFQGLPLAARAQYVEDRIRAGPIRLAGSSPVNAVSVDMPRQQRLQYCPPGIRDLETRGRPGIRCATSRSLGLLFFAHASYSIRYSDRL